MLGGVNMTGGTGAKTAHSTPYSSSKKLRLNRFLTTVNNVNERKKMKIVNVNN